MREKTSSKFLQALLIGSCYVYLILCPKAASAAASSSLSLCARVLVPSLFPFFVCANLFGSLGLTKRLEKPFSRVMGPVFGVPGSGAAALVLGLTGGYPSGAQAIGSLYAAGSIDEKAAQRLLCFCNNCGPAFLFGVVGGQVFGGTLAGLLLYLVHIVSALALGVLFGRGTSKRAEAKPHPEEKTPPVSFSSAFTKSVLLAGKTAFSVCLFAIVFGVLSSMATGVLAQFLPAWAGAVLTGILELSGGAAALGAVSISQGAKFVLSSMLLAFGGLSVHAQTKAVLEQAGLANLHVFPAKLLHAALAGALSVPVYALFRTRLEAQAAFAADSSWLFAAAAQLALGGGICLACLKLGAGNPQRNRV